jgi:hypothetical protein
MVWCGGIRSRVEWFLVVEFRFCGRFSVQTQRPPSDTQGTWIDEAAAPRRWHTEGAELTAVPPADPATGRVPYVVVITCGASPAYTVRRFLPPIFCDLELWWKNTGDGLALDVVHAMVFPEPAEEWDEALVSTTARLRTDGSVYLTRAFRADPGVRDSWVTEPPSELAPLNAARLRRAEPAWGMWNELLDLSMLPAGVSDASEIDRVLVGMREASSAAKQRADSNSEGSASQHDGGPTAWPEPGAGGFRYCGSFDTRKQDVAATSSWLTEDQARRVMFEPGGELTLVGPEQGGVPRVLAVVECGHEPAFQVSRQMPPGVPDLIMFWRQNEQRMVLESASLLDYDEPIQPGDEPALKAQIQIGVDGGRRLMLSSKGSSTFDTAEMAPVDPAEAQRAVPAWGEWADLLDAPEAAAR